MANINLLPWREELREEKKREFFSWVIMAVLIAVACLFLWLTVLNSKLDNQKKQNAYIKAEIEKLDAKAKVLDKLKTSRQELLNRVEVIQELQGKRPKIVHVFDELTRIVPKGVYLTQITRTEERLAILGTANNNNDISNFMRQFERSGWFYNPALLLVNANDAIGEQASDFQLAVSISDLDAREIDNSIADAKLNDLDDSIPPDDIEVNTQGNDNYNQQIQELKVIGAEEDAALKAQLAADIEQQNEDDVADEATSETLTVSTPSVVSSAESQELSLKTTATTTTPTLVDSTGSAQEESVNGR